MYFPIKNTILVRKSVYLLNASFSTSRSSGSSHSKVYASAAI